MEEILAKLGVPNSEIRPSGSRPGQAGARLTLRPKRSRLERYVDILRVVRDYGPMRRTHILYKANLSWADLGDSLDRLEGTGTIHRLSSKRGAYYEITQVGLDFLAGIGDADESDALATQNAPRAIVPSK